ncbi:copper chaperone PCu(A)C [Sphingomonas sp.]|uniref:copper chaperone PCu(A)C n=1 Tax=Sphingomonas sp. TaxID=28214 RepID=UPI003AFF666A
MRIGLLALLLLAGACHDASADRTRVDHAWVRLPALPDRPGAAYLVVHGGAEPVRLVAVDAAAAGSSELHRSMGKPMAGGMSAMSMERVDGIDVPAHGQVALAPQGYHAMLFALDPKLKAGSKVPLTIRLAKGQPIAVEAKAVGAGDAAPY